MAPTREQREQHEATQDEAAERQAPSGKVVYHAILREGEEELERPSSALFWSGLAAGLSMGFSLIAEGLLKRYLPEAEWSPLVSKLGYSLGFLIVVLGRQQLFTENTLTPILPLLRQREGHVLVNVLRLWGMVLGANLVGALAVGSVAVATTVFEPETRAAFVKLGEEALAHGWVHTFARGIFAGWLIALMVWLLPFAEAARVWVIIILTYIVGLGKFSHIVAGAVEVFGLAAASHAGWGQVIGSYMVPTLLGNIVGGVTLVAALNHAQVAAGKAEGEDL